jgi:hypothetical protein
MGKIKVDQIEERVSSNGVEILSTPKVDTISELTSAAGVTVDGVLLKDSQVSTDVINEKTSATGVTIDGVLLKDGEIIGAKFTDYSEKDVALSSTSGVVAVDLANGNTGSITLSENITDIDFTNVPTNGTSNFTMKVTQDSTGSRTMAINAITVNGGSDVTGLTSGGAGVTLSTAASSVDLVTFLFFDAATPLINVLTDFQ